MHISDLYSLVCKMAGETVVHNKTQIIDILCLKILLPTRSPVGVEQISTVMIVTDTLLLLPSSTLGSVPSASSSTTSTTVSFPVSILDTAYIGIEVVVDPARMTAVVCKRYNEVIAWSPVSDDAEMVMLKGAVAMDTTVSSALSPSTTVRDVLRN